MQEISVLYTTIIRSTYIQLMDKCRLCAVL